MAARTAISCWRAAPRASSRVARLAQAIPAAPASAFWALGFGGNYVYVDREHDLVVVLRWVPDGHGEAVISAIVSGGTLAG